MSAPSLRRPRRQTVADMVRSLGLVLGVVAVVSAGAMVGSRGVDPVREVDWEVAAARAGREAPYPVLVPTGLGPGWRATSVDFAPRAAGTTWQVGFVTPEGDFAGLWMSDGDVEAFLRERLAGYQPSGLVRVGGLQWRRWAEAGEADPDLALSRVGGGVAVVVVSSGTARQAERFAATLRSPR